MGPKYKYLANIPPNLIADSESASKTGLPLKTFWGSVLDPIWRGHVSARIEFKVRRTRPRRRRDEATKKAEANQRTTKPRP